MIPKLSRFKCCHCGYLKKRPGKCVWCGKIANFENLMEVAWQSAGTVTSLPGELQTANTQRLREQRSLTAIIPISPDKPGADGRVGNTENSRVTKRDTVTLVARDTHWLR